MQEKSLIINLACARIGTSGRPVCGRFEIDERPRNLRCNRLNCANRPDSRTLLYLLGYSSLAMQ
jgi:hypothetical protein